MEADRSYGKIAIKTCKEDELVVLQVSDNGMGVPEANRDMLFRKRRTTKEKGHGYGLVTCGKIISEHGGEIRLESTSPSGTTIPVELPMGGPPSCTPPAEYI